MGHGMKTWESSWDIPAHVYNKYRQTCYPKKQHLCKRFQVKGQHVLHGKTVLILVVALCILDCCLVITELILDIHAVKDELSKVNANKYKDYGYDKSDSNSSYPAGDSHSVTDRAPDTVHSVHRRGAGGHDIPLTMEIAHACHYASVAILGVLLVYVILKFIFFGKEMFSKKLEMFDAFVVLASFVLDLAFLDGVTNGPIENTAFILSFFVPWRVLRVVNSLVVAILDQEHYKLVVIYKSKKRVELNLDEVRDELHESLNRVQKLKELSLRCGVEEWRVNLCLAQASKHDGKKNVLSSFASLTFGAMGPKKSAGLSTAKTPIRMPKLENVEETKKPTPSDKEEISSTENKKSEQSKSEDENRRSLSGDSALSMSLDTEQNDVTSSDSETPVKGDETSTNNNTIPVSAISQNNIEIKEQTTPERRARDTQGIRKDKQQNNKTTVVNMSGFPERSNNKNPDHTTIDVSVPTTISGNGDNNKESGHDNEAFVPDDCYTKL